MSTPHQEDHVSIQPIAFLPVRISKREANMDKEKGISGVVTIVFTYIGYIAGVISGLILAPQSGKKSREKIRETYTEGKENIDTLMKKADEKVPEVLSRVTSDIKNVPGQVRNEIIAKKHEAEETLSKVVNKGKLYLEDIKKTASSSLKEGKKKFKKEKNRWID